MSVKNSIIFSLSLIACSGCSLFGSSDEDTAKEIISAPLNSEEELLSSGLNSYDDGMYSLSVTRFTDLRNGYPASYWTTLAQLKIADAQFFSGNYTEAVSAYEEFINDHPGHEALPYARYQIGKSFIKQYHNNRKDQAPLHQAIKKFGELLKLHPDSPYSAQARRYLDKARELLASYELEVAKYYKKREQLASSNKRLLNLINNYPDTSAAQEARSLLQDQSIAPSEKENKIRKDKINELTPPVPVIVR